MPVAFYASNGTSEFLVPLLIREVPLGLAGHQNWYDAATPYGYPAPLIGPRNDVNALPMFLAALKEQCLERNIVSAFFRLHPLIHLPPDVLQPFGTLVQHGATVYVDLSLPLEALQAQTRVNHRRNIRKLLQSSFQVVMDDWGYYSDFINTYHATMKRVSAGENYFFNQAYFDDLRMALDTHLHLVTVLSPEGSLAAAGLFVETGEIVQYHLGGTVSQYLNVAPSKLMFDFVRQWAKENAFCFLHLGGGLGGQQDDLFHFKRGFSNLTANFYTYRMIFDEDQYRFLTELWQQKCSEAAEETGFFPIYRKPCEHGLRQVSLEYSDVVP
jgi:lipid II:glycine glycyltransferase (peptidoglycan interpeptide bridge formation enzyme)